VNSAYKQDTVQKQTFITEVTTKPKKLYSWDTADEFGSAPVRTEPVNDNLPLPLSSAACTE